MAATGVTYQVSNWHATHFSNRHFSVTLAKDQVYWFGDSSTGCQERVQTAFLEFLRTIHLASVACVIYYGMAPFFETNQEEESE